MALYYSQAKYWEFDYKNVQSIKWSCSSWFFRTISVYESLYGLRSNGPQKLCIPNMNSDRFGKGSIQYIYVYMYIW